VQRSHTSFCILSAVTVHGSVPGHFQFFREHSISELAAKSDMWLNQQGRLTEPMVKRPGSDYYEPISWDGAFGLLAAELRGLDSPDEALFYTSGRLSNEAAFRSAARPH
jgi:anaerobic selenocysteine-containing dehydrogenase